MRTINVQISLCIRNVRFTKTCKRLHGRSYRKRFCVPETVLKSFYKKTRRVNRCCLMLTIYLFWSISIMGRYASAHMLQHSVICISRKSWRSSIKMLPSQQRNCQLRWRCCCTVYWIYPFLMVGYESHGQAAEPTWKSWVWYSFLYLFKQAQDTYFF